MNLTFILLQAAPGQGGLGPQLMMILLIIVIFYFFMIRPQMKKAKQERLFKDSLQKGDKIVTIGGIHAKIVEIAETTFLIEVDSNVKLRIEKTAVSAEATKAYNPKTEPAKK
ncbi:MAG: preprotein translocase subunit YajC [Bacteroidota bacterium]|jgi:preprotein translocase subunit YajC